MDITKLAHKKSQSSWRALEFRDGRFAEVEDAQRIHMLDVDRIAPNPNQPRHFFDNDSLVRLADSIKNYGVLQPVCVRRAKSVTDLDTFELVAGERRLRAAKMLGMTSVPCRILDADEGRSAEMSLVENTQRADLNFFEEASAIAALLDAHGITQEELARRLSASQSFIANKLRILRLTPEERSLILKYSLTERHARALLRVSSPEERLKMIEHIHSHDLSVAASEAYIERYTAEKHPSNPKSFASRVALKDIRVFYNSVDRAISTIRQAGIAVESERVEEDGVTVLTIRIANDVSRETS